MLGLGGLGDTGHECWAEVKRENGIWETQLGKIVEDNNSS
jgi:hypothetical protein